MQTVNIHEAKTHLSRLINQAAEGESFIIAKAGRPLVKVIPIHAPTGTETKRCGFMMGQVKVPKDFDQMHAVEIAKMFGADK